MCTALVGAQGDGEWEFVLDMVSELFSATLEHTKAALQGCIEYQKGGDDMDWDSFLAAADVRAAPCTRVHVFVPLTAHPPVQKIFIAAHTIKGAANQVYCGAIGNAAEAVEHAVRLARDIVLRPELASSEERT